MAMDLEQLLGVRPNSDLSIAFSISPMTEGSQGRMTRRRGSGVEMAAIWLSGVGTP